MNWLARLIAFLRAPRRPLPKDRVAQPIRYVRLSHEAIEAAVRGD